MNQQLNDQDRIDTYAFILVIVLFVLIAFISSFVLSLGIVITRYPDEPGVDSSLQDGMAFIGLFVAAFVLLSPLWLWLAFKMRRAIGWPKKAFERVDFAEKKNHDVAGT